MARPSAALHRRLLSEEMLLPPGVTPPGSRGVILGAALRLFAEHGYGGTSVRDIAKATGIQPATMYSHYPSKEHVLSELIKIGHEEHHRLLCVALQESAPDPREQLAALVHAHVLTHATYPMLTVAANSELHALSPKLAAPALELRKQSEQLFGDVIQRGMKARVFNAPDAWLAMAAIAAMGLRVANWYTPDFDKSAAEVAEIYAKFALRIVGAR
jgi:AcrR family transcriptional regulator